MAKVELELQFISLPLDFQSEDLAYVPEWQFHLDELKAFFSNRQGSRKYFPEWGFNFNNTEDPYTVDELRSLILSKLNRFFSYLRVESVEVVETDIGQFEAEITIVQSPKNQTVVIEFR